MGYEMGISDWSSDVCSSDLRLAASLACHPAAHAVTAQKQADNNATPAIRRRISPMKFTSHSSPASATIVGGRQRAFEDGFREAVRRHFLFFVIPDLIRNPF